MSNTYVKDGSTWKTITGFYAKVGTTWQTITAAYVKDGATWKTVYSPSTGGYVISASGTQGTGTDVAVSLSVSPTGDSTAPAYIIELQNCDPPGFSPPITTTYFINDWTGSFTSIAYQASPGTMVVLDYKVTFFSTAGQSAPTTVRVSHQF